jgi:hypothetical protein
MPYIYGSPTFGLYPNQFLLLVLSETRTGIGEQIHDNK